MPSPYRADQLSPEMRARYGMDGSNWRTLALVILVVVIFLGAVGFPGVPDHVSLWGLLIPIRHQFQMGITTYYPALDHLYDEIATLEERIFSNIAGPDPTEDIYRLQSVVLRLTRVVAPLVEVLNGLRHSEHPVITADLQHYVADTNDDVQRVMDTLGSDRDVLLSALEANLTKVSIRQNEDMRKMSAWAAIIAVPTAIAGIYGMNFRHMPELESEYGYFIVLAGIATICLVLWTRFKKSGWL